MEQRLAGERDPYLRKRVPVERIEKSWGEKTPNKELDKAIKDFRQRLQSMEPIKTGLRTTLSVAGEE